MNRTSESNITPRSAGINNEEAIKAIENDREFKAFIYQHLAELQPYLAAESQVAVLIQVDRGDDEDELDDDAITISLVATLGDYRLEADGRDTDMYEAFGQAKNNMIMQLEEYFNLAIDSSERDAEIRSMLAGHHTLH